MVSENTVITLEAGFATANKVRANEKAKGFNGFSKILGITRENTNKVVEISTTHFDITCTPSHILYKDEISGIEAKDFKVGDTVLTTEGIETIVNISSKEGEFTVYGYKTKSGVYIANSFYSLA